MYDLAINLKGVMNLKSTFDSFERMLLFKYRDNLPISHILHPSVRSRDQTKDRKTLFLLKISAEISAETLSVIILLYAYLQKELLSAERLSFGREYIFW